MLHWTLWDPKQRQHFEGFSRSGRGVRGVRVGWSSFLGRKGRQWIPPLPQPNRSGILGIPRCSIPLRWWCILKVLPWIPQTL